MLPKNCVFTWKILRENMHAKNIFCVEKRVYVQTHMQNFKLFFTHAERSMDKIACAASVTFNLVFMPKIHPFIKLDLIQFVHFRSLVMLNLLKLTELMMNFCLFSLHLHTTFQNNDCFVSKIMSLA